MSFILGILSNSILVFLILLFDVFVLRLCVLLLKLADDYFRGSSTWGSLSECQLNVFVPRASLYGDRAFLLTWVLSLFSLTLFVVFYQNFFISCGQQPHFCAASTFVGVWHFIRVQVIAKSKNFVWDPVRTSSVDDSSISIEQKLRNCFIWLSVWFSISDKHRLLIWHSNYKI